MMAKFLDIEGLNYVWNKIKVALNEKSNTNHTHNYAGSSLSGGAATKALADGKGNNIETTYCTKTELTTEIKRLEGIIAGLNLGFVQSEAEMKKTNNK